MSVNDYIDSLIENWPARHLEIEKFNENYDANMLDKSIKFFRNMLFLRNVIAQRNACKMNFFTGKIKNMNTNSRYYTNRGLDILPNSLSIQIPIGIIDSSFKKAFVSGGKTLYTFNEINAFDSIFDRSFILFIDKYMIVGFKVLVSFENFTIFIEPNNCIPAATIASWNEDTVYEVVVTRKSNLLYTNTTTKASVLGSTDTLKLSAFNQLNLRENVRSNDWIVGTSIDSTNINMLRLSMGSIDGSNVNVDNSYYNNITMNSSLVNMKAILFTNIYMEDHKTVTKNKNVYLFDMPIKDIDDNYKSVPDPKNMLVFKKGTGSNTGALEYFTNVPEPLDAKTKTKIIYPNYYMVNHIDESYSDELYVVPFYSEDLDEGTKFINPIEEYIEFNPDYPYDYLDGSLPPIVEDYVTPDHMTQEVLSGMISDDVIEKLPSNINYHIINYINSDSIPYPVLYQITKIIDILSENPSSYKTLYESIHKANLYMVGKWSDTVSNLGSDFLTNTRMNNGTEITNPDLYTIFDEEHIFLKVTHRNNTLYPISLWIDGELYSTDYRYIENFVEYIYLPKSLINNDSSIEIQSYIIEDEYRNSAEVYFEDLEDYTKFPDISDTVSSATTMFYRSDTKELVPNNFFFNNLDEEALIYIIASLEEQMISTKNDELIATGFSRRRIVNWFKRFIPSELNIGPMEIEGVLMTGMNITVQNTDLYHKFTKTITSDEYPSLNNGVEITLSEFIDEPAYYRFRVYINGNHCPNIMHSKQSDPVYYTFNNTKTYPFSIFLNFRGDIQYGDVVEIEYLPYSIKHLGGIYHELHNVFNDRVLKLSDIIKRPFSFEYYDMYINGRKMNKNDIYIVTDTIVLVKDKAVLQSYGGSVASIHIYEKEHDYDIYGNEFAYRSVVDRYASEDPEFLTYLLLKYSTGDYEEVTVSGLGTVNIEGTYGYPLDIIIEGRSSQENVPTLGNYSPISVVENFKIYVE